MDNVFNVLGHYFRVMKKEIDLAKLRHKCEKIAQNDEKSYISANRQKIYTSDVEVFNDVSKNNIFEGFWETQTNWSLHKVNSHRWNNQMNFMKQEFIPLLKKTDCVFDVACATGEWSFLVSPYVKRVDGFELSAHMVEYASKESDRRGFSNTSFVQADITKYNIKGEYNNGMCLGMLTFIFNEKDAKRIVEGFYKLLKNGGFLVTKDTLNIDDRWSGTMFVYNYRDGYKAIFRDVNNYYKLYKDTGFELIKETDLDEEDESTGLRRVSRCVIWKKPE